MKRARFALAAFALATLTAVVAITANRDGNGLASPEDDVVDLAELEELIYQWGLNTSRRAGAEYIHDENELAAFLAERDEDIRATAAIAAPEFDTTFLLPEQPPFQDREWAVVTSDLGDGFVSARGTTQWRLEETPEGTVVVVGHATFAEPTVTLEMTIGPPPFAASAHLITLETDWIPPERTVRNIRFAVTTRLILDATVLHRQEMNTEAMELIVGDYLGYNYEVLLLESATLSPQIVLDNGNALTVSLALGETGRAALTEAYAAWREEAPWLDLTGAVIVESESPELEPGEQRAYFYETSPDGTLRRHDTTVLWEPQYRDRPTAWATVELPIGEFDFVFQVDFSAGYYLAGSLRATADTFPRGGPSVTQGRWRAKTEPDGDGTMLLGDPIVGFPDLTRPMEFSDIPERMEHNLGLLQEMEWMEFEIAIDGRPGALVIPLGEIGRQDIDRYLEWLRSLPAE